MQYYELQSLDRLAAKELQKLKLGNFLCDTQNALVSKGQLFYDYKERNGKVSYSTNFHQKRKLGFKN